MKIAVLGVGVIGKVHIKILNKLGIKEPYFLSRTEESGKKTSDYLYNSYGIRSKYYSSLESLISFLFALSKLIMTSKIISYTFVFISSFGR